MHHVFIINPIAGRKNSAIHMSPVIDSTARMHNLSYTMEYTEYPGHAAEIAETHAKKGTPIHIYACGGDGTLSEVIQGAYKYENAAVAPVACGSGNDFVRNFGGAKSFLDIAALIMGESIPIDLINAEGVIALNNCAAGIDAAVANAMQKYRRVPFLGGSMGYNVSVVEQLAKPIGHRFKILVDEEVIEGHYLLANIANGISYGGGYHGAPCARLDDGLLDMIFVNKISRIKIASILAQYKSGSHLDAQQQTVIPALQKHMQFIRGRKISIESDKDFCIAIDGECRFVKTFSAEIIPNAGRIVLPAKLADKYLRRNEDIAEN